MFSIHLVCVLLTNLLISTHAMELELPPTTATTVVPSEPAPLLRATPATSPVRVTADCLSNSLEADSVYCRGSRAIRNVIRNLNKSDKPLVLVRGLEIVPSKDTANDARASPASEADSFLGCVAQYLRSHELNIKFSDLLADESEQYLTRDLERNGVKIGTADSADGIEEARKKDKGQGLILAMAMMFGKMMAVMGMGGIGALAMKALGIAMAALMMAGIVGLKSLSQHGGGENKHSVQYVTADGYHHKRRRRSIVGGGGMPQYGNKQYDPLPLVYKGWQERMK